MIEGVKIKNLKVLPDERGRLMELLRADDEIFDKFGQVYMTTCFPGVIKAWHYHEFQQDNTAVLHGMVKMALFDDRRDSSTYGELVELYCGEHNPVLVQVPPFVVHGFKCIGDKEAIIINIPNMPHNREQPDMVRIDPHDNHIPYNWARQDG